MKYRYYIGFFVFLLAFAFFLDLGYQKGHEIALNQQLKAEEDAAPRRQEESIAAKGQASRNTGYYLREINGYVAVYLFDQVTLYEQTSIELQTLPATLQSEIATGKYIETTEELYGFLENYSS